jgi:hypothetical protein
VLGVGALLLLPEMAPRPVDWHFVGEAGSPPVYRELARRGLAGAVVEVPFASGDLRSDLVRMWHSTLNWNPTSAGYSGYEPPGSHELRELAVESGPGALLSHCRSLGFRYVIIHLDDFDAGKGGVAAGWARAVAVSGGSLLWADDQSQLLSLGGDSDAGHESARLESQEH